MIRDDAVDDEFRVWHGAALRRGDLPWPFQMPALAWRAMSLGEQDRFRRWLEDLAGKPIDDIAHVQGCPDGAKVLLVRIERYALDRRGRHYAEPPRYDAAVRNVEHHRIDPAPWVPDHEVAS